MDNRHKMPPIVYDPDFTPENGIEPEGVPVLGCGVTGGLTLCFPNGSRVPVRSTFLDHARRGRMRMAQRMDDVTAYAPDQLENLKLQLHTIRQREVRALDETLEMFGINRTVDNGFELNGSVFPAIMNGWKRFRRAA